MPEQEQVAGAESAAPADARKLAREVEKIDLIREIAILACRKDAIEELMDKRKDRLEGLMAQDGERERVTADGDAKFSQRRTVNVVSAEECVKRFSKLVLAEHFSPPVAFIEACDKEKKDYKGALIVGLSPIFKCERARTKAAKELQKKIVAETMAQAEATVAAIQESLRKPGD